MDEILMSSQEMDEILSSLNLKHVCVCPKPRSWFLLVLYCYSLYFSFWSKILISIGLYCYSLYFSFWSTILISIGLYCYSLHFSFWSTILISIGLYCYSLYFSFWSKILIFVSLCCYSLFFSFFLAFSGLSFDIRVICVVVMFN
jgi:hypothetical protein